VLASSSSVYGDAPAHRPSREDDEVRPLSRYGATKHAAERLCLRAGLQTTVVRLFTVYGPHQRPDMAFQRFIAAAGSGAAAPRYQGFGAARDFTFVTDAVDGMVRAWHQGVAPVYNVSGGQVTALGDACRLNEELMGVPLRTAAQDAPPQPTATHADLTLARRDLGYRPAVALREGLAAQIAAAASVRAA
jgi:nucleoside-diphosphate-sugar epimerase